MKRVIKLGFLVSPTLRVQEPIRVTIERSGGEVMASSKLLSAWGYGPNVSAAVKDLQLFIEDVYEFLTGNERNLGPGLKKELAAYRRKIREVRPMTAFNFIDNPKKPKGLARQGKNSRHNLLRTLALRLKERRRKKR